MTADRDAGRGVGTGVPGDGAGTTSTGHDVGGVGGPTAAGGGIGTGDSRSGAAGTGLQGGAAAGEGLNDIGPGAGGLGSDPDVRPQNEVDAKAQRRGPGASGDRA